MFWTKKIVELCWTFLYWFPLTFYCENYKGLIFMKWLTSIFSHVFGIKRPVYKLNKFHILALIDNFRYKCIKSKFSCGESDTKILTCYIKFHNVSGKMSFWSIGMLKIILESIITSARNSMYPCIYGCLYSCIIYCFYKHRLTLVYIILMQRMPWNIP